MATQDAIELTPRFLAMGWPSLIAHAPFGAGCVGIDVALGFLLARPRLAAALVNTETHA